ncbi:MAG: hypothetical protein P1V35_17930, partial [Planctomycetota bacterium]|nr:hypothetical protein [Planctomycetota bacterium]
MTMRTTILVCLLTLIGVGLFLWAQDDRNPLTDQGPGGGPALQASGLQAGGAVPGERGLATAPENLPGVLWVDGQVTYPDGFSPAADTRVWGKGAEWSQGNAWYGARVAADGTFRMAFAEGTEAGSLFLQDPRCWSRETRFRAWLKQDIAMEAFPGQPQVVQVEGVGVDVDELHYVLESTGMRGTPLFTKGEHQYRFALETNDSVELVVDKVEFPVAKARIRGAKSQDEARHYLLIQAPATIHGTLLVPEGTVASYPWVLAEALGPATPRRG